MNDTLKIHKQTHCRQSAARAQTDSVYIKQHLAHRWHISSHQKNRAYTFTSEEEATVSCSTTPAIG